ncbi:MAG: hypothetical protein HFI42_08005 [Lachnospiraceae bacterium]|nr:hypothetical protein [Lachnospiraceae bacterium]
MGAKGAGVEKIMCNGRELTFTYTANPYRTGGDKAPTGGDTPSDSGAAADEGDAAGGDTADEGADGADNGEQITLRYAVWDLGTEEENGINRRMIKAYEDYIAAMKNQIPSILKGSRRVSPSMKMATALTA